MARRPCLPRDEEGKSLSACPSGGRTGPREIDWLAQVWQAMSALRGISILLVEDNRAVKDDEALP